jgi:hypothetical protein
MNAIQSRGALSAAILLSASLLAGTAHAYTPEQQQACTGDAFRVCGSEIPNIDRITVCMIRNRALLSPGCRVFFRSREPVAIPEMRTRRSVRMSPATLRHPVTVKPAKPKKPRRAAGAT